MKRFFVFFAALCLGGFLLPSAPTKVSGQGGIDTSKWYHIIAKHSSKCLDMQNADRVDGRHLIQYTCHDGDNQRFKFVSVGSGYYQIVVGHSRKCVDQIGANYNYGGIFGQYGCHSGQNQQFLPSYSSGYYQFNVRHSSLNMDVLGGSYSDGAQLVQYLVHGGDNQLFSIQETVPPCYDEGGDADADSWCANVDCDDNDPDTHPGAPIFCEFGYDRNCNNVDDEEECNFECCPQLRAR